MFTCKPCAPADPTSDTVKVDIAAQLAEAEQQEQLQKQEAEAEQQRQEAEERRRAQEAEAARLRAEAEAKRFAEEEARRVEAERQAEEARRAEEARKAAEAAAERARLAEEERQAEAARKAAVAGFLKEWNFSSVSAPRKKLMKTSYAIHKAAKLGNAEMVVMLLQEGADPKLKDSRGKTAAQIAASKDSKGSHAAVMMLLGGQQTQPTVGGA